MNTLTATIKTPGLLDGLTELMGWAVVTAGTVLIAADGLHELVQHGLG